MFKYLIAVFKKLVPFHLLYITAASVINVVNRFDYKEEYLPFMGSKKLEHD